MLNADVRARMASFGRAAGMQHVIVDLEQLRLIDLHGYLKEREGHGRGPWAPICSRALSAASNESCTSVELELRTAKSQLSHHTAKIG